MPHGSFVLVYRTEAASEFSLCGPLDKDTMYEGACQLHMHICMGTHNKCNNFLNFSSSPGGFSEARAVLEFSNHSECFPPSWKH